MKKYDFQKIDKLLQPLMEMMREEFPNACKLIVQPDSAQIVFEHNYLTFLSNDIKIKRAKQDFGETKQDA